MKQFILIFIFILTSLATFAQVDQKTFLYNNDGELIAKNEFKINQDQLKNWAKVEAEITTLLSQKIVYPEDYQAIGLQGVSIVSFKISSDNKLSNVKIEKSIGGFDNAIISAMQQCEKELVNGLKINTDELFYIPLAFVLEGFKGKLPPIIKIVGK
ncbi:energy transducer TonB [Solitalea sp. MAHUQ-68]|uniref:Energy transducer TonB n=1 Tax=Solitalea agri TaxID=2953739 RepID=A0A9X2JB18_9SPHI|nr:energy transducer TonB [Solitalea agri]MCO4292012.1 energy transducer TonB [Solitalea agri]